MAVRDLVYRLYARRLTAALAGKTMPRHLALVMDGNRRWARQNGYADPSVGHAVGAEHVEEVLGWCAGVGIMHVSIFVASADNLAKRSTVEVDFLMDVIERVVSQRLAAKGAIWRVHVAGRLDLLPDSTAAALKTVAEATYARDTGHELTVAVGYGGRAEIVDTVRGVLDDAVSDGRTVDELEMSLTPVDIANHLYTQGLPDADFVIRTSGEQRLSDFLLWQTTHSELYFCDVYWPGFRYVDFLRALRSYAARGTR